MRPALVELFFHIPFHLLIVQVYDGHDRRGFGHAVALRYIDPQTQGGFGQPPREGGAADNNLPVG